MIGSLLIANRGEIARRVIRTAHRLGVRTIAIYSEADAGAPHWREADTAVAIGLPAASDSYLAQDKILDAARKSGAEAIHPGYGFLSENAEFAEAATAAGFTWVGPPPAAIRAMGRKDAAKRLMAAAGVPTTRGYLGEDQSETGLARAAAAIGWPVLIKAVAGGGGKGMRKVATPEEFSAALASAKREAAAAFGDDRVFLERYIDRPRHIEVQIFGDRHGNVVHLFERDCSIQRRYQKVIEEAPAPGMDAATRQRVCAAAVAAARAVAYEGAGTVEFIADASRGLSADRIWFMEMNTRLQVEHPVTEAITGLDLVEWQLRVASGEPLPLRQEELAISGWAIEARLYAENPAAGFLPCTGPLRHFQLPGGVRIDSGVEEGGEISSFYDPLIAKIVVAAPTRTAAAKHLAESCSQVEVWPLKTNAGFLARTLADPDFLAADIDTSFIADRLDRLIPPNQPSEEVVQSAASARLARERDPSEPWRALEGFRLNAPPHIHVNLQSGDTRYQVESSVSPAAALRSYDFGDAIVVFAAGEPYTFTDPKPATKAAGPASSGMIASPLPGRVVAVSVRPGDRVAKGQPLMIVEAMKIEHTLRAPFGGIVSAVSAVEGHHISEGVVLARINPEG
ncbi:MAG TPA: biotin carboxylase N-terminal domain-containing protein [Terriglobia bacterium]|nr:biotin carboxylase N-terminal domain-containing protein [Terriglobia bacterium]